MSRTATARLFVAVDPPPPVCRGLVSWARDASRALGMGVRRRDDRSLRLLDERALHLTLCFLGSRPLAELDTIAAALEGCDGAVGELLVGAPAWLPPRHPRALAVTIHDRGDGLVRLHDAVSRALAGAIAWEPERRRFRAHVTLARISGRGDVRRRGAPEQVHLPATPALRFTPPSLVLYRSWLPPSGASYEAIASSPLMSLESKSFELDPSSSSSGSEAHTSVESAPDGTGEEPSSHFGSDSSSHE